MDWDDLRYLLALQRHESLAGAARSLKVDQTTVGRRLNALQEELGTRLFDRSASGHRLTEAGVRACGIAHSMESAASTIERQVAGQDIGVEGMVRITVPTGLVPLVAPALAELRAEHPGLAFHVIADVATLNLLKGEADIAIRAHHQSQPSLVAKRVGQTPWAVFASKGYVRRRGMPRDLVGHDVVGYDERLARTPGGEWLSANAAGARVVVQTNNVIVALEHAAADMGIVTAPIYLAARYAELQRVLHPLIIDAGHIYVVTHQDLTKVPRVRATIDRLTACFRANAGLLQTGK